MLRRLEWRVRHAVETVLTGDYRSAFRGRGMEFDQVVKYEFGDDVRDIDWNVTARLGEPYRKKFVEEREVCLLLVFEDSPSLAIRLGRPHAARDSARTRRTPDAARRGQPRPRRLDLRVARTASGFAARCPGVRQFCIQPPLLLGQPRSVARCRPGRRYAVAFHRSRRSPPQRAALARAHSRPRAEPEGWTVLRKRYQTMGFRADDPWDRELPASARLPAYDPLAGRIVLVDTDSPRQRRAHAEWVARREATLRRTLSQSDRPPRRSDRRIRLRIDGRFLPSPRTGRKPKTMSL